LLRDAETRRVGEKLVEKALKHNGLSFAHGENDGFARVRLRALLFDAEIFVNDELEAVLALGGASPIAETDFLLLPFCALECQNRLGGINLVVGEEFIPDAFADGVGKCRATLLRGAVPALKEVRPDSVWR